MEYVLNALAGRIRLDFRSDDPIFLQIVRQIEALVGEGSFKPGDQLPTVRELAIDLRINFSTVARAYRILDERRLISTQRGRGTFIEESAVSPAGPEPISEPRTEASESLLRLAERFVRAAYLSGAAKEQIEWAFHKQLNRGSDNQDAKPDNQTGG
jgi:GntR family transcriptional regulator